MKHLKKYEGFFTKLGKRFSEETLSDIIDSNQFKIEFNQFNQTESKLDDPNIFYFDQDIQKSRPYHKNEYLESIIYNDKILVFERGLTINMLNTFLVKKSSIVKDDVYFTKVFSIPYQDRKLSREALDLIKDHWSSFIFDQLNDDYSSVYNQTRISNLSRNNRIYNNDDFSGLILEIGIEPKDNSIRIDNNFDIFTEIANQISLIIKSDTGLTTQNKVETSYYRDRIYLLFICDYPTF